MNKIYFTLLFFILIIGKIFTQEKLNINKDIITNEIISILINIKINNSTGSSFLFNYNGNKYLITAKHVLGEVVNKQKIYFEYFKDSLWEKSEGVVLIHNNTKIDIAIIDLQNKSNIENRFELSVSQIIYGDDGYFLGFPFNLRIDDNCMINSGLPIPLVKKALLSAFYVSDGILTLLLDGQNNPGFSGGPIVFRNYDSAKKYNWRIIGVVSGYQPQNNILITPNGTINYHENSGIMVGYGINHVFEILQSNNK